MRRSYSCHDREIGRILPSEGLTICNPAQPQHTQLLPSPSVAISSSRATGDAIGHDSRYHVDTLQQVWHDSEKHQECDVRHEVSSHNSEIPGSWLSEQHATEKAVQHDCDESRNQQVRYDSPRYLPGCERPGF